MFRHCVGGLCALLVPAALFAGGISVPSGQPITFLEFITDEGGKTVRFRFLTPDIGTTYQFADVADDFQVICDEQIMPVLTANALEPVQIVLSMSAEDMPFGEDNPDVLQFFEIFRPDNDTCIWEEF